MLFLMKERVQKKEEEMLFIPESRMRNDCVKHGPLILIRSISTSLICGRRHRTGNTRR